MKKAYLRWMDLLQEHGGFNNLMYLITWYVKVFVTLKMKKILNNKIITVFQTVNGYYKRALLC